MTLQTRQAYGDLLAAIGEWLTSPTPSPSPNSANLERGTKGDKAMGRNRLAKRRKARRVEEYQTVTEKLKLDFGDLMDELRALDPRGWNAWYDEYVPDWDGWLNCGPAMTVIRKRIEELKGQSIHADTVHPELESA